MSVTIMCGNEELNVSNANFFAIAKALGDERLNDYCGSIPATDLRDICKAWQSKLELDGGVELSMSFGELGTCIFDCGRERGYLNIKVQRILEIAEVGIASGEVVSFG